MNGKINDQAEQAIGLIASRVNTILDALEDRAVHPILDYCTPFDARLLLLELEQGSMQDAFA